MIKNKEHGFQVELVNKTYKIDTKEFAYSTIEVIFDCEVGYGHVKSFNSYYGSQPCYDEEYEGEIDYEYEVDFDLLSDKIFEDKDYCQDLIKRNPDLFHAFYDDENDWIWETDEQTAHDLIVDALAHKEGFRGYIQDSAQSKYDDDADRNV